MPPTTLRLLVLEDEPNDAELNIAELQDAGYHCEWKRVDTRADFLEQLDLHDYDLILSDYSLPAFDGLTALRLVLEHEIDTPFILVSGTLGEDVAIESLKAGATDYVLKQRLARLGPVVRRALSEHAEQRARKEAEKRAIELAKFPSENPHPVLRIAADGTILYGNRPSAAILERWGTQLGEQLRGEPLDVLTGVIKSKVVCQEEIKCEGRTFVLTFAPVPEGDYANVYGLDVTQERVMEAQLRQSQKLESIGTLASGVAHEINNPINGIMNYSQLILDELGPDHAVSEFAAEIVVETERVVTIVRSLLSFACHERKSHSPASICDIVGSVLSLIRAIMRHDQITLNVDVPEELPAIKCRSQQIKQVMMNLLTNARDAVNERYAGSDENKTIQITARVVERDGRTWIRTTVEDSGLGIPDAIRERIFDPFYTTKPRDKGTGLGLSISHGIVKEHHGELSFESEPGKWTRFHMDLPVGDVGVEWEA